MESYSLATLWYERQRYLPGVLAVAFSALLIALQCGLLLGLFSITSIPIDHTRAHVWMGAPQVLAVDLGRPISENTMSRMGAQPEIEHCEIYLQGFAFWSKPKGGNELCMVIGSRLSPDALGKIDQLTPEQCGLLGEEGAVIIDASDVKRLGVSGVGSTAEISGFPVRVVGLTHGLPSLAGPWVFCSVPTARKRLPVQRGPTATYVLGRCRDPKEAPQVVERLRQYGDVSAFTSRELSRRTQIHWLTKTKAGAALGYAAALGLLVGAVVTSQTLYAATIASLREYAVLRALGIPRWRMGLMVVSQSFWIGIIGVVLAFPAIHGLAWAADRLMNVQLALPWWLQAGAATVTLVMALLSGLFALRSLRLVEPATLLR